jgi:hypothetical protein
MIGLSIFAERPKSAPPQKAVEPPMSIPSVIERFRLLISRHPEAVIDVAALPLPKADMKLILQTAWIAEENPQRRAWLELGYSSLGNFREGVGSEPISFTVTPAPAEALRFIGLISEMADEGTKLAAEFDDFKRRHVLRGIDTPKPPRKMPMDRRTLLDQRDKARRVMHDLDMPMSPRMKAKSVVDKADVSLGLRDALARKLGSMAAVDQALAALPDPEDRTPYPMAGRNPDAPL